MSIRDILVHLDNLDSSGHRLQSAIRYSRKHGAELKALYIESEFPATHNSSSQSDYEKAEMMFREKTLSAGIRSEWISAVHRTNLNSTEIMTTEAYYSDLVVVGQTGLKYKNQMIAPDLPERLVMRCGRPVLIVPDSWDSEAAGERIMIAWKAGRESVRSVNDALPLIKKAVHVSLIEVSSEVIPTESNNHIMLIKNFMAKHGISTRTEQIYAGDSAVGETILELVAEKSIDLLVMGAYTHTMIGNLVVSPVADHVLKNLTLPVLMSH